MSILRYLSRKRETEGKTSLNLEELSSKKTKNHNQMNDDSTRITAFQEKIPIPPPPNSTINIHNAAENLNENSISTQDVNACPAVDISHESITSTSSNLNTDMVATATVPCSAEKIENEPYKSAKPPSLLDIEDPLSGIPIPTNFTERGPRILKGPYRPNIVRFPYTTFGNRTRAFNPDWFKRYTWLEYSKLDAAFCFYCRFFGTNIKDNSTDIFTKVGFKNWYKAKESFNKHETSAFHIKSANALSAYELREKHQTSANKLITEASIQEIAQNEKKRLENRKAISRLVDIVITLAKAGRPFRGHDESKESNCRGLFLDTVDLLRRYDPTLNNFLKTAPKNATYLSAEIQNDFIASLHDVMFRSISNSIRAKKISIMADETSDAGHHEQMCVVIRYFDEITCMTIERFVCLRRLLTTDAATIFNLLDSVLNELGASWQDVVSVCFDGASTMSGHLSGVQTRCKEINPRILYVHCYAHCLNLVLVDACKVEANNRVVFDFFGVVQFLYSFIEGSPTRHATFEHIAQIVGIKIKTLKSLSTTRWACRAEAVSAVKNHLPATIQTLEEICENSNYADSRAKAGGILHQTKSFQFLLCLEMVSPILNTILITSTSLQDPNLNLWSAYDNVKLLRASLVARRNETDPNDINSFSRIFQSVTEQCEELGIEIPPIKSNTRRVSRRIDSNPSNQFLYESKEQEMRICTYYPFLDALISGIDERFSQETNEVIEAMSNLFTLTITSDDITVLSRTFQFPVEKLEAELTILQQDQTAPAKFEKTKTRLLVDNWIRWMSELNRGAMYSTFNMLLVEFTTIPVTSCSCERGFSKLVHVKSKLRVTMTQHRLDNLMLPYIEQALAKNVDIEAVIDDFKATKKRQIRI